MLTLARPLSVIRARAGLIIVESGVQLAQVQFMFDQMVQRKFKAAGLNLLAHHNRQQQTVSFAGFVAGHAWHACKNSAGTWNFCTASTSNVRRSPRWAKPAWGCRLDGPVRLHAVLRDGCALCSLHLAMLPARNSMIQPSQHAATGCIPPQDRWRGAP